MSAVTIEPFSYSDRVAVSDASWESWAPDEVDGCGKRLKAETEVEAGKKVAVPAPAVDFDRRLREEARRSFEAGRERGLQEGRAAEREAHAEERRQRAEQLERLADAFGAERDRYLAAVEQEVVKLALQVAARVLRREAQMDPLLLLGAVRVALGQLSASTTVRLRVPAGELGMWKEAVALLPGRDLKLEVAAGDGMRLGDCVLETELGSVDLGVRAQLGEIERGFFDRAAKGTRADGASAAGQAA